MSWWNNVLRPVLATMAVISPGLSAGMIEWYRMLYIPVVDRLLCSTAAFIVVSTLWLGILCALIAKADKKGGRNA